MTNPPTTTAAAIEREFALAAAPERVWHALTDPAELAAWFCQAAELAPLAGHTGYLEWAEHGRFAIQIEAADAPRYLAWRWARDPDTPIDAGVSTLVEWWLEPAAGGGTRLRLRESGFERDADRSINALGWLHGFGALARHLASEPWQAGIVKTYRLASPPERVWRAFADPSELAAWWSGSADIDVREGFEGWWVWPKEGGRYAMAFDRVEPPTYLAWRWTTDPEIPLAEAAQVLRTEWVLEARDGGTNLHLLETGFRGPKDHALNDHGWDGDVIPALRRHLGEDRAL
jgi:uncharacterized protein YndB with AHSA1/START domain